MPSPEKRRQKENRQHAEATAASVSSASFLYFHFPFCLSRCHYCDFNSYVVRPIPFAGYRQAVFRELSCRKKLFEENGRHFLNPDNRLETVYIGGGTPSLVPPADIDRILAEIGKYFSLHGDAEITLEANPGTIDAEKLLLLKRAGVNRISVGIQSLNNADLKKFGRIHSAIEGKRALDLVADAGFRSWNADLIFGFPGQSLAEWRKNLLETAKAKPPHISCYGLSVEEESSYCKMVKNGFPSPQEDVLADMFLETRLVLESEGYKAYEISNFCLPGFESRHNLNYWNYGEYLGIGAGAVSFFHNNGHPGFWGLRTSNLKKPEEYMKALVEKSTWFDSEEISLRTAMGEFMMLGLRLERGIDEVKFEKLFGCRPRHCFGSVIEENRRRGFMELDALKLAKKGFLFSNQVMAEFL